MVPTPRAPLEPTDEALLNSLVCGFAFEGVEYTQEIIDDVARRDELLAIARRRCDESNLQPCGECLKMVERRHVCNQCKITMHAWCGDNVGAEDSFNRLCSLCKNNGNAPDPNPPAPPRPIAPRSNTTNAAVQQAARAATMEAGRKRRRDLKEDATEAARVAKKAKQYHAKGPFGDQFPVQQKFVKPTHPVGTCVVGGVQHKFISEAKVQKIMAAMRGEPVPPTTNPKRANAWTTTPPRKPLKSPTPRTPLKSVNTITPPSSASKLTNDKLLKENVALSATVNKLNLQVASLKSLIEQISIKAIEISEIASMEDIS